MNVSERISQYASNKVILDFFPNFVFDEDACGNQNLNDVKFEIHAGAFCLYSAVLMTKIYENENLFEDLKPECFNRARKLLEHLKSKPKFANLTEEELNNEVKRNIKKEIRNCFAHGNFEISFDEHLKKLNFVLNPLRPDLEIDDPIIISKNNIIKTCRNFLCEQSPKYLFALNNNQFNVTDETFKSSMSGPMKNFICPSMMLKLAEFYLDNKLHKKSELNLNEKIFPYIQYTLLASKITYEEDEYYKIFGKDSNIFNIISLIRNSVAHDNFNYKKGIEELEFEDKSRYQKEPIANCIVKLLTLDEQKNLIKNLHGKHSQRSIDSLANSFKDMFSLFFEGENSFEDFSNLD